MSKMFDLDGTIIDVRMFKYCYGDYEWFYHYQRYIEFKQLCNKFNNLMLEEYEMMSLREEELGVGE